MRLSFEAHFLYDNSTVSGLYLHKEKRVTPIWETSAQKRNAFPSLGNLRAEKKCLPQIWEIFRQKRNAIPNLGILHAEKKYLSQFGKPSGKKEMPFPNLGNYNAEKNLLSQSSWLLNNVSSM